ncbi:hypothetical protein CERZMDRAFT_32394 [Cercospora zeae-maydis SCOH1-5]|uniref:Golgi apyrase n=1 Tax=Cercospora zeae-maydis SCOH1-5 TaxID=717836 RepID=A0A6A6FV13_9PEZI|nr:hypothetical protein CERZMDRAFT_32394 [Cercospora zeae-maydis SCOH1-5]
MGKHKYGLVFDAGSSGTRVYVYKWDSAAHSRKKGDDLHRLPEIETKKKWIKKVHPGISTFGDKPELVGPDHLGELVDFALDIVPKHAVEDTPVFLLATAGMRLLPDDQRAALLEHTCSYFQRNTKFQLPDCGVHVQVIPGETEGLYGWIAANYLLGGFDEPADHDHGKQHNTYGFLDMGGASAQIAFAPNATEAEKHANDLKLLRLRRVDGESLEYKVFVTTWLGFGANEARRRYVTRLLRASPDAEEIPDPCLPVGIKVKKTGEEIEPGSKDLATKGPHLIGTGDFTQCLKSTYPLLEKEKECKDAPCLLNGQHTPAIDFDVNHFVGVSEYWHTTHEIFSMAHKDKAYDFASYQKQVTAFCSRDWADIEKDVQKEEWGHKVDEKTVEEVCFKASWLINMLHEGIGVPRLGIEAGKSRVHNKTNAIVEGAKDRGFLDPFQAVDKIDGKEVSWTLGKIVLYASSQMPAAEEAKAVGFGSNIETTALPYDWQHPAGHLPTLPANDTATAESDDWHDRILSSSYGRRAPGILIFLLIFALAVYLLCGRERRQSWYHKMTGGKHHYSKPRKGASSSRFLSGKLFGSPPTYERVLEEGADPSGFELGDFSDNERLSDSSADLDSTTRAGRTSGLATPGLRERPGSSHGLGIATAAAPTGTLLDRAGLIIRSESKESLRAPSRSRRGSPTRRSPLMMPLKESLD